MNNFRLSPTGNGETQCVIFANDYEEARKMLGKYSATVVKSYPFISAFGVYVNLYDLKDIMRLSCIHSVAANSVVKLSSLAQKFNYSKQRRVFSLYTDDNGFETGVTAAFIDTGFSPPLDFYLPRIRLKEFVDFINDQKMPYDDNGHGTAVGCLIAGDGRFTQGSRKGTSERSDVVALKAIGEDGTGNVFGILEAMQWVYSNSERYSIKVLCMSLGSAPADRNDPLALAAKVLWRSGITVVASAGNGGEKEGVGAPGICKEIITVGSVEKLSDGSVKRAPFSAFDVAAGKPDVCADGMNVACVGIDGEPVLLSGTSVSAPLIAGICCNILKNNRDYSPDKVKQTILSLAIPLNEIGTGSGFIDI